MAHETGDAVLVEGWRIADDIDNARRLGAARGVDMPRTPRPTARRGSSGLPREVPGRASWSRRHWRSAALFWCAGSPRPAARAAARTASGCRPAPLGGHPRGNAVHRPRSWSRRASWGTAATGDTSMGDEGPAPARTADHALVGLWLDERGASAHSPAPAADARISSVGAAVAGRAALLAALVFRARLVLLACGRRALDSTAPSPNLKLFQRLDPVPRRLRALAQAGVLPGQRLDRSLLRRDLRLASATDSDSVGIVEFG